jgi:Rieske Fe-S protein
MRRRESLGLVAGAALAQACGKSKDPRVRVALAELPSGSRTVVAYAGEPVEVVHGPSGVSARSLLCTHFGCRVAWDAARERYRCPCHEGWFDAEGRPLSGPPTRPLRAVRVVVERDTALVGEP